MKAVAKDDRKVANIHGAPPSLSEQRWQDGWSATSGERGQTGFGFHVSGMLPVQHIIPHRHIGDEEFLLIEYEMRDHGSYEYRHGERAVIRSVIGL